MNAAKNDPSDAFLGASTERVQKHVGAARFESRSGAELVFKLPFDSVSAFPALFTELDQATVQGLGIGGYSVSMTTLEEVFLRLAHAHEEDRTAGPAGTPDASALHDGAHHVAVATVADDAVVGQFTPPTARRQFAALFGARLRNSAREPVSTCAYIIFPSIFIIAALVIGLTLAPSEAEPPKLRLTDPDMYRPGPYLYANSSASSVDPLLDRMRVPLRRHTPPDGLYESFQTFAHATTPGAIQFRDYNASGGGALNVTVMYNDTFTHALPQVYTLLAAAWHGTRTGSDLTVYSQPYNFRPPYDSSAIQTIGMTGIALGMAPGAFTTEVFRGTLQAKARLWVVSCARWGRGCRVHVG